MMGYYVPARINTLMDPKDHPEPDKSEFVTDVVRKKSW